MTAADAGPLAMLFAILALVAALFYMAGGLAWLGFWWATLKEWAARPDPHDADGRAEDASQEVRP